MIWGIKTRRRQKRLPDPTGQVWRLKITTYIIKNHFSPGQGSTSYGGFGGGGGGVLIDGLGPTGGDVTHGDGYGAGGGGPGNNKPGHKGVIILDFIRDN